MANIRISQLPTAPSPITGSELIPIVQSGQTVQTTVSAIVNSPVQTQTFLTKNQETTLPNSRYLAVGAGLSLADGGAQSTYSITPVGALASLVSAGQGFMVKTSGTDLTNRSIAVNATGLSITNGDGTTGNPTISLTNNLLILAGATGTGLVAIAGNSSLSIITIAGTANQIAVTNGNTSPVIGLANNPIVPGTASLTLPAGGTGARPSGVNGMIRYNSDLASIEVYANNAWGTVVSGSGVSSFSAGTTGFTPSTTTTGAVVLAGILNASNGGTGASTLTGYVYGNGTGAMTASTTIPTSSLSGTVNLATQVSGTLPIANGGTGQTSASTAFNALSPVTTLGDLIVGTGTNTNGRIGVGSNGQILTVVSGAPAWANPATAGTVTSVSFTGGIISVANPTTTPALTVTGTQGGIPYFNTSSAWTTSSTLTLYGVVYGGGTSVAPASTGAGTTGQVLLANTSAAPTWGQVSLTAGVTGILPVANGGTGVNTLTAGYVPYGAGTSAFASVSTFNYNTTNSTLNAPTMGTTSTTSVTPSLSFNGANAPLAMGATVSGSYLQVLAQNKSGTAGASVNYVLSNDLGTDSTYYGEFGMNSSVFSASTPADFFSINNAIYFSAHDGDVVVGSGNGFKYYLAWGTTGQSAHVINASGAIGLNTNLGTTPALSGTTNFGTSGQVLTSGGSSATPTWTTPNATTVTLANGSGATNYLVYSATATGNVAEYTSTGLTYNATNTAITGGINGGIF